MTQDDLEWYKVKDTHTCTTNTSVSQISLRFALRSLAFQVIKIFQITETFGVSTRWIWNFRKKIALNRKNKISKIPNSTFMIAV